MAFGGATTPALTAAVAEVQAKNSSSARPTYVESKLDNGTEPHVPVGQAEDVSLPQWGAQEPSYTTGAAVSAAPSLPEASSLPRVAGTFTGIAGDVAPGVQVDGDTVRYANRDGWDGELLLGDTHDLHSQMTNNTGWKQLLTGDSRTRRQEIFTNQRKGFGLTPTAPQATPVNYTIDQVAPDAHPTNGQFNGSLNASTLGAVWNGSGSAYSPVPAPADAVNIDTGNGAAGQRTWG